MFQDLNHVIEQVGKDKGIDKEILIAALEEALLAAAKKNLGAKHGLEAHYNEEEGEIEIFQFKYVVEEVEDPLTEMSLEEAKGLDSEAEIGDSLGVKVDTSNFGRIAAQTAKQVIIQRVKDAERENVYMDYKDRKGEIINGIIQRFDRGDVIVNLGRVEAVIPHEEQVPKEVYRQGDRIRAYVLDVMRIPKGPQIILSRKDKNFLIRLFELEVPEISEGIVTIRAAAREPGERSKIAVSSQDLDVDPVGACVGMKGSRVQSVVQELRGERIDIIPWTDDFAKFVCNALSPAEISKVIVDEENRTMEVIVADDQLSLAIGKKGQNVRLASKLTNWRIDVQSESKAEELSKEAHRSLRQITGVGDMTAEILFAEGYRSAEEVARTTVEELSQIDGIGMKKAQKIKVAAKEFISIEGDAVSEEESASPMDATNVSGTHELKSLEGLGEKTCSFLLEKGIKTIEELSKVSLELICSIPGIGKKKAQKLISEAQKYLSKEET